MHVNCFHVMAASFSLAINSKNWRNYSYLWVLECCLWSHTIPICWVREACLARTLCSILWEGGMNRHSVAVGIWGLCIHIAFLHWRFRSNAVRHGFFLCSERCRSACPGSDGGEDAQLRWTMSGRSVSDMPSLCLLLVQSTQNPHAQLSSPQLDIRAEL